MDQTKVGAGLLIFIIVGCLCGCSGQTQKSVTTPEAIRIDLDEHWLIQSSDLLDAGGEALSTTQFSPMQWYETAVPSTVMAALVENEAYPDPFWGMNLRDYPGMSYEIGHNFAKEEMAEDSPFRRPWWYRTEFTPDSRWTGKRVWLHFDGINYRADVFLNGKKIADQSEVAGTFRQFVFDVTDVVQFDGTNVLAVAVDSPRVDELGVSWVDWNPTPPDKNMGLWDEVYLQLTGPVALRHPQVTSKLVNGTAHLEVYVDLVNGTNISQTGRLRGAIESKEFDRQITLGPGETKTVRFHSDSASALIFEQPRLWWPAELGRPERYSLSLVFETAEGVSDVAQTEFGIREITSKFTDEGHLLFHINGKPLLIRGAGYTPDMFLRFSPARAEAELAYVLDMHLNAIRLEGKLGDDHLLELCDRLGILVIAGWCCCDRWEQWDKWSKENHQIGPASLQDQIRRLRNHPSVVVWMNASDMPPPEPVEQAYLEVLSAERWPNPILSSASETPAPHSGPSGVKMNGPYDWVPPNYWLEDKVRGGAFGFNTEAGPGPAIPEVESLRRFIPENHLWPIDEFWHYHAGGGQFRRIEIFRTALAERYGPSDTLEDFVVKAQVAAYEGIRAMFEAYGRNKYQSTGIIQWMLNDGWPSMIWHLYDYYLKPSGGYFGAKKALEPLHIQYAYDNRSVVLVNQFRQPFEQLTVEATVTDLDGRERFVRQAASVSIKADSVLSLFEIPENDEYSQTYLLRLVLTDAAGTVLSRNIYWLSQTTDLLDHKGGTWYYTPTTRYADLTGLAELPEVALNVSGTKQLDAEGKPAKIVLVVENPSPNIAFFIRLEVTEGLDGREILPILYQDNNLVLWPKESQTIEARFPVDVTAEPLAIRVSGMNVRPKTALLIGGTPK